MKKSFLFTLALLATTLAFAQPDRWQQACKYEMNIDMDVTTHQYAGTQKLTYINNSPDDLYQVFYHLYFNAFQPGSMMDMRNQELPDSDKRVKGRIGKLKPNEIGYIKVSSLKMNGKAVNFETAGTILEVQLDEPVKAGGKAVFEMEYTAQVPVQIRRSGRDNAEGISYSMSQWYPKMCEYDYQGWHANPYVGREFHGIWGDFDVKISIDKFHTVAATGYLQNKKAIGHGYGADYKGANATDTKLEWHFKAENVHDFFWGADPDYKHTMLTRADGTELHFFYQETEKNKEEWAALPNIMDKAFDFVNKKYGQYPYKKYSFVQGGDGGMEYPMGTLITGNRSLGSLVGVSVHELMHSWYQMVLGTNEALYAWMDEGFTSYASAETMNWLKAEGYLPGDAVANPHAGTLRGYKNLVDSGREEPLTTHADHFDTNFGYGLASYVKGAVFIGQLEYVMGEAAHEKAILKYFDTWKFKHPNPNDFIRIMEKESGLELDWYKEYMVQTLKTADYAIEGVSKSKKETQIVLRKIGKMPMPLDITVTDKKGNRHVYNIPLRIMRGNKAQEDMDATWTVAEDWPWTNPTYTLTIPMKIKKVVSVEIDASGRMFDMDTENNTWSAGE